METVEVLFMVSIGDVSQPRHCTFESNEHVYDMWIQILSEFNLEQLVGIVYNQHLKIKYILER